MTDSDPLKSLFEATEAPRVDPVFRADVMSRVAQRRLRIELAIKLVAGLLILLAVATLAPALGPAIALLAGSAGSAVMALVLVAVAAIAGLHIAHSGLPAPAVILRRLR